MRELQTFDLSSLASIDGGRIALAFKQELTRVVRDCDDRPGEGKPRKITLELELTPKPDETGRADDVDMRIKVNSNVPKRQSKPYNCSIKQNGSIAYQPGSLEDHTQHTMDFDGDDQ